MLVQVWKRPLARLTRPRSCRARGRRRPVIGPGGPRWSPAPAAGRAFITLLRWQVAPRLRGLPTLPGEINWSQHITFLSTFLPSHRPVSCSASVMTPSTEVRRFYILTSVDLSARLSHSGAPKPRRDHHTLTNEGSGSPEGPVGGDGSPSQDGENWLFPGERAPETCRVFNHPAKQPIRTCQRGRISSGLDWLGLVFRFDQASEEPAR